MNVNGFSLGKIVRQVNGTACMFGIPLLYSYALKITCRIVTNKIISLRLYAACKNEILDQNASEALVSCLTLLHASKQRKFAFKLNIQVWEEKG